MKVAFATTDLETINDHFGWAKQFAIYDVNENGYSFAAKIETPEDKEEEDDKINYKVDAIKDCAILYCQAIGPTAAARVVKNKIHPIKVQEPKPINEALDALVTMLGTNPPPWIRRIVANGG